MISWTEAKKTLVKIFLKAGSSGSWAKVEDHSALLLLLLLVILLPHQQRHSQWVLEVLSQVESLGRSLFSPQRAGVRVVHQIDDLLLVRGINGRYRDVPDSSELATVVDVLVLKSKKVPYESAHHFQYGKYRDEELIVFLESQQVIEKDLIGPGETENQVLKYGKVVISR